MVKSLCSSPSTSLPSSSFTVTGTVTKLTVRCSRNNSSRPLSPALEALPVGTVLIPGEPGGGASGLVGSGNGCCQPVARGIRIDTSASQTRVLDIEQTSCAEFLHSVLRNKDLAFVINFDVDVDLDQDFTNNVHDLTRALNRMQINAGMGGGPPGLGGGPIPTTPRGTLLYDAIYLGANDKLKNEVGRKAMIVFTDGEDQGSRLRIQDAIEAAQKADTICYVILIADRGFYGGFGYSGDYDMKKLAEQTGGRVIEVGNKQEKLRQAFDQIQNELRSQYNMGYTPTNTKLDGSYRKIQIRAKGGEYKIQARQGYYAMAKDRD